jgi:succinoglycan biosynthesis protein ExoA
VTALSDLPFVTVIMPVRQEAAFIAHSLGAVLAQDYPRDRFEIIVADGRSSDGTCEIVRALQVSHPNLRLVENPGLIVPTGLNVAIHHARGDVIVRVDGHTEIAPDYVRECVATLRRTGADNVGGCMNAVGVGAFGEAVALATSTPFGVGNARFHYSNREDLVDTVYMGAWPRDVFTRIGLFDEALVRDQDDEFNYRLLEHGGRIWLNPGIRSRYVARSTARGLWRQYFQYGYWKVRVMQKHPKQMRYRQFIPALFVASCAAALLAAPFSALAAIVLVLTITSYFVANVFASVATAGRRGWRHLFRLPVIFCILHVAYGAGFLVGLMKFSPWLRGRRQYLHEGA